MAKRPSIDFHPKRLEDLPMWAPTPEVGKQLGIQQVTEAADRLDFAWKHRAYLAVIQCASQRQEFICDDVWTFLEPEDRPPQWPKPKALGGVIQKAARDGFIRKTDRTRTSKCDTRHLSPAPIWESLTHELAETQVA